MSTPNPLTQTTLVNAGRAPSGAGPYALTLTPEAESHARLREQLTGAAADMATMRERLHELEQHRNLAVMAALALAALAYLSYTRRRS